ncbi:hypothetical protein D9M71_821260 [compost metagenome]
MAFLADKPTVVIKPTWKYTSAVRSRQSVASTAPKIPRGTTMITETGTDQLSYSAARHRKTTSTVNAYSNGAWSPAWISS